MGKIIEIIETGMIMFQNGNIYVKGIVITAFISLATIIYRKLK